MRANLQVIMLLSTLALAGCMTVGPDYVPPKTHVAGQWHTDLAGGLHSGTPSPQALARWWTIFNDPVLSNLIERAIADNLSLKEAKARIQQARAIRGIRKADYFPTVNASATGTKSRSSEHVGTGIEQEVYDTGFDAAWELDIFGGTRRSVEAAQANLEAAEVSHQDTLVSLVAEVARNYVEARTLQARLDVAQANIKVQEKTLNITNSRFKAGMSSELPVQQALYNLSSTRSNIPTLNASLEAVKNRLAVLVGQSPGHIHQELAGHRPIPVTPASVAVGIPSDIIRRRPDIRRAERALAAQTARIGMAKAELYPSLRLTGSFGLQALESGDLFTSEAHTYSWGPSISLPIFNAGAIRNNIAFQTARQEEVFHQYQATILAALEEVENNLTAYAGEQMRRQSLVTAQKAASRAVNLAWDKHKAGMVDFGEVLEAQRSALSFEDELAQSNGSVTTNLIRLYKSIGGGWPANSDAASPKPRE